MGRSSSCITHSSSVVTFGRKVRVRKIARILDMEKEDIKATYYSHEEMVHSRNMLRATIRIINEEYTKQQNQIVNDKIGIESNSESGSESSSSKYVFCGAYQDTNCDCCHNIHNNDECYYNEVDDTITFCLRGLETEFPKGKQRRRRNKTIARDM